MTTEIIIPQNALSHAKSRLEGCVDAKQRQELARELLVRTMTVARQIAPISVVSPSAALCNLVRECGGRFIYQRGLGLNTGVSIARDNAVRRGIDMVAIVHADLPFLQPADLHVLLESARGGVAIAPDKSVSGTNALALATDIGFSFRFGPESFASHRFEAVNRGSRHSVVRRRGLSLDLDTPADLHALLERRAGLDAFNH